MKFSVQKIAQLIDAEIDGDENLEISGLSKIDAGIPGTLTFLANPAYTEYLYSTGASAVIVQSDFKPERALPPGCTLVKVKDPYGAFASLLDYYNQLLHTRSGVSPQAVVHAEARVGEGCYIGELAVVEEGAVLGQSVKIYPQVFIGRGVTIGDHSVLYPGVRILADCHIGSHCILHSGVVIGGDGFGFAPNSESNYKKVAQIGNVVLEDHVEVGANTTIDRATLGSTLIKKGVKLDNLIQIAHNVEIGEHTVIAAQTGVAGSTRIGRNCMIGGQVGIVGHLQIADGTMIAAQSGIGSSVKTEKTVIQGSPAFGIGDYKKSYVGFKKLPTLMRELSQLKEEIMRLQQSMQP